MARPEDDRIRQDQERERTLRERERARDSQLERSMRARHDAIGVSGRILDPRVRSREVIMPELSGFVMVATKSGGSLSQYETGPIRNALLIRALGGDVERAQVALVQERDDQLAGMLTNPVLQEALRKYADYDMDVGDRPEEMTGLEAEAFGQYENVRMERQAIVDAMTDGVAALYDAREDLANRSEKLKARLAGLEARVGSLDSRDMARYEELLAKMFAEIKGPEAINYSRWSNMDPKDLRPEERVMLEQIWRKMIRALDGGEAGELEDLREENVRELSPAEKSLLDKRLRQLRAKIEDPGELAEFDRLWAIPDRLRNGAEVDDWDAYLILLAEQAGVASGEMGLIRRFKNRYDGVARRNDLEEKERKGQLSEGERGEFEELRERAGTLTQGETESIETIRQLIADLKERVGDVERQIAEKTARLGKANEWMQLAIAFDGMVSNINVTDQWRRAWHDLVSGSVNSFTETRWAEYQRTSELVELMRLPGVGTAMQEAFRAMCIIGLDNSGGEVRGVPGARNIMAMDKLSEADVQNNFVGPIERFVRARVGVGVSQVDLDLGVEMARMLFENSFCAAWFCVGRDGNGDIVYSWNEKTSSNPSSPEYMFGVAATSGDGTLYPDRQNDYIKPAATRVKQMKEFEAGYETGLPALVPVLPDSLVMPWINHQDMVAIANGKLNLIEVFEKRPENSRWGWAYGMFRSAQIYEMVSKFVVGLKGFRGAADEVMFFFQSLSNVGSLAKKLDVSMGHFTTENQRLRMNFALALLYAIDTKNADPNWKTELKTILANRGPGSGGVEDSIVAMLIKARKDDIGRVFVERTGFLTKEQWDYVWDKRFKPIAQEASNHFGIGMIKKGEALPNGIYRQEGDIKAKRARRRYQIATQV